MQLSEKQLQAVETINGQVILISCPGSGKTSTVVRRVRHMVEQGVPADQILVLTFSNAAAKEMAERYDNLCRENGNLSVRAEFSTIHSFCYKVVAPAYGLGPENILRETEAWMIVRQGLDFLKKSKKLKMDIRDFSEFTSSCIREISLINNNGVDWGSYVAQTCPTAEFKEIYDLFTQQKRNMGKIDFDDMLSLCYEIFQNQPWILEEYKRRYPYIIVDEYQDTNYLQADILYMLAGGPDEANLCVVGDDDQSIYKFRGARPEIMLNFSKTYPGCQQIHMSTNYRSEPEIILAAKRLISFNKKRFQKDIQPAKTGHGVIETFHAQDSRKEIFELLRRVTALRKEGCPYEDMAVLFRNNRQASFLSIALMGKEIPFHSNDAIVSPYSHWIFSDIVAFYKLAEGCGTNQNLIQVINKPNRFLPVNALRKADINSMAVKAAVRCCIEEDWKLRKAMSQIDDFFMNLRYLQGTSPDEFLKILQSFMGYGVYLREYARYRNMDVTELTGIIASYEDDIKNQGIGSMAEWLKYADEVNRKIEQANKERGKKGLAISTMHKSKGLEWKAVFIIGANEGTIPSSRSDNQDAMEEERRLFYVACTRAKERLCLSWIHNDSGETVRSRFVGEFLGESQKEEKKRTTARQAPRFKRGDFIVHRTYGKGKIVQAVEESVIVKFDNVSDFKRFSGTELTQLSRSR